MVHNERNTHTHTLNITWPMMDHNEMHNNNNREKRGNDITTLSLALKIKIKIYKKKKHIQMSNMSMSIVLLYHSQFSIIRPYIYICRHIYNIYSVWIQYNVWYIILWLWFAVIVIFSFYSLTFCGFSLCVWNVQFPWEKSLTEMEKL